MAAKPIPDGFHSVTPYLTVRGAVKVVEFLKQASFSSNRRARRLERHRPLSPLPRRERGKDGKTSIGLLVDRVAGIACGP